MSNIDFDALNNNLNELKQTGTINKHIGNAMPKKYMQIKTISKHAMEQGIQRGIHADEMAEVAQTYVNNAIIMLEQSKGTKYLFLSLDGSAVIVEDNGMLITIMPSDYYDPAMHSIIGEVQKCLMS